MTVVIRIKHSSTPGATPGSLAPGELAINEADKCLFFRDENGAVSEVVLPSAGQPFNAGQLGGLASSAFAQVAQANTFSQDQKIDKDNGKLIFVSTTAATVNGIQWQETDDSPAAMINYRPDQDRLIVEDNSFNSMLAFPRDRAAAPALWSMKVDHQNNAVDNISSLGIGTAAPTDSNTFGFYGTNAFFNTGGSIDVTLNKNAATNDGTLTFKTAWSTRAIFGSSGSDDFTVKVSPDGGSFFDALVVDKDTGIVQMPNTPSLTEFVFPLGGQYLLDPNEFNGWGVVGPYDDNNSQDLGNVGVANPNRQAGGLTFPFRVRLKHFFAWHNNNNGAAEAWGWRIHVQRKDNGTNNRTAIDNILDEVGSNGGVGPRDYSNNRNQLTDIDLSGSTIVEAGDVIILGVESPTAVGTNYYVRLMAGYFLFERIQETV